MLKICWKSTKSYKITSNKIIDKTKKCEKKNMKSTKRKVWRKKENNPSAIKKK